MITDARLATTTAGLESQELERAILGAILWDDRAQRGDLPAGLPTWLTSERHRLILRSLLAVDVPDVRTVEAALRERGELEAAGGIAYIAGLDVDLPAMGRLPKYVEDLRQLYHRRRLAELGARLAKGDGDAVHNPLHTSKQVN